jgi:hypothetical protein
LKRLRAVDKELLRTVRDFFEDLRRELGESIGAETIKLAGLSISERFRSDYQNLCASRLGATFSPLLPTFNVRIESLVEGLRKYVPTTYDLFPAEAEAEFLNEANTFLADLSKAQEALAMLEWASSSLEALRVSVGEILWSQQPDHKSLLAVLLKGKAAALSVDNYRSVRDGLRNAYSKAKELGEIARILGAITNVKEPLAQIKLLVPFAESETEIVFKRVAAATHRNRDVLYKAPSTLPPAPLARNRSGIESRLKGRNYEVAASHFANASLQRATALSFLFALLDHHPRGLRFVLLDDTILSLDEDHRETWVADVIKPQMPNFQFVISTHQREFINNCKHHFNATELIELLPRANSGEVRWRPGHRLDRAAEEIADRWTNAPIEMRKYREEVVAALDGYAQPSFALPDDAVGSVGRYAALQRPNLLASSAQPRLSACLLSPDVERVLNPGAHGLTEHQVTSPMVKACLQMLRTADKWFAEECDRLAILRNPSRATRKLPQVLEFPDFPAAANWNGQLPLRMLGQAAARSHAIIMETSDNDSRVNLQAGAAVLALSDTLEPIIRRGDWPILAAEDAEIHDGNLAANRS